MARHDDIDERMKAIRERREEMHWGDWRDDEHCAIAALAEWRKRWGGGK